MFSAYAPAAHARQAHQAYAITAVEGRTSQASPHELVSMLFDGVLEDLQLAKVAILKGDTQRKGVAIGRAVRIVEEGLRGALNMRAGGHLAQDLNALYGYITSRLTQANLHGDTTALDECVRLLQPLREAWKAIGQKQGGVQ